MVATPPCGGRTASVAFNSTMPLAAITAPAGSCAKSGARRPATSAVSMAEQLEPVMRHPPAWPGDRLVLGTALGRRKLGAFVVVVGLVIPEPVLAGFERPDYRMPGLLPVLGRMTRERVVAATDVSACGATPQVHPPTTGLIALDAAHTAGRH